LTTSSPDRLPIIVVENLTAGYGDLIILENISFEVYQGEILVILGGSGCGKSTLMKNLIGLYKPLAGRVLITGVDVHTQDDRELHRLRRHLGVAFQSGALFGSMTVAENIALPLREYTHLDQESIMQLVRMKLALVGLAGYDHHLPQELSGGMQKRVGLARALALDPEVVFFDEPAAGLDPVTGAELDLLIKEINAGLGTTMVVITHELASIFTIAHRVLMLDKSEKGIIAQGDPRVLQTQATDPRVWNFFNRQPSAKQNPGDRYGHQNL